VTAIKLLDQPVPDRVGGDGDRRRSESASAFTRRCANRETPPIGANGVDDLRLRASEPSGRAGTGDAHHHRFEHSEAPGHDACGLDGLTSPFPLRGRLKL